MMAAVQGYVTIAELFIESGADINAFDKFGNTPLSKAWSWPHF